MKYLLIGVALFVALISTADAKVINQSGGRVDYDRIGSWYPYRVWFSDKESPCFAVSLSGRTFGQVFTLQQEQEGTKTLVFPSFDANFRPKPGEVVQVLIGDQSIEFVHPKDLDHKRFFPVYQKDVTNFFKLILARERSGKNHITVTTKRGGKHLFRIKGVKRVMDFLTNKCGKS